MSDNKNRTGEPDRSRVSLQEDYEVQYWTERFKVDKERLAAAVRAAGDSVENVDAWLKSNPA
jgi:hypothetical protein